MVLTPTCAPDWLLHDRRGFGLVVDVARGQREPCDPGFDTALGQASRQPGDQGISRQDRAGADEKHQER
jgi:hypothetical protein